MRTPNLDRLARHYSQAAPCGPGRASLYTGMYQMNHRVVANGTPLDRRFDNVAKAARRAGGAKARPMSTSATAPGCASTSPLIPPGAPR